MEVKRIFDPKLIESIYKHPHIWKELTWGLKGKDLSSLKIKIKNNNYYGAGYIEDTLIGGGSVLHSKNGKYYCHLQLFPEYRSKYGIEFGRRILTEFWSITKPKDISEIYLIVHPELRHILIYALKLGFKKVDFGVHYSNTVAKSDSNLKRWLLKLNREDYHVGFRRWTKGSV